MRARERHGGAGVQTALGAAGTQHGCEARERGGGAERRPVNRQQGPDRQAVVPAPGQHPQSEKSLQRTLKVSKDRWVNVQPNLQLVIVFDEINGYVSGMSQ